MFRFSFVLLLLAVSARSLSVSSPCPCTRGDSSLRFTVDSGAGSAILSNGFLCVHVVPGRLKGIYADYDGVGEWGKNVLSDGGMTVKREDSSGAVYSSGNLKPGQVALGVVSNDTEKGATLKMLNIVDVYDSPAMLENWTFALAPASRTLQFHAEGGMLKTVEAKFVSRQYHLAPTSLYAWFDGGVVQMKNAAGEADFYISDDTLKRFYALGGSGSGEKAVGNYSFDWAIGSESKSTPRQFSLLSSSSGTPYWSGLQEVLAGGVLDPKSPLMDNWRDGWESVPDSTLKQSSAWDYSVSIAANDLDFPVGTLTPGKNLCANDIHALMIGIYASPAGNLCTHTNEVRPGVAVGQMATSIALPVRGYNDTYNYFDPDNYLATSALSWSNEHYLQEQVRTVLERSGAFLKPNGQLPHHFVGIKPVYQALSGEIQTGPNVFWILSCFNYAKASQNFSWLKGYMPTLRLASQFLFSLIDQDVSLAKVPGSLMIDVFLRSNFTSDTNAQLVGFFQEFADAEDYIGNATGAKALRSLAARIKSSMNKFLWASKASGDDHFVTQWNGPDDNTVRDFVDYDSNLIAAAHGVVDTDRASRLLKRIDTGGQCRASATFVSERYYGPTDTTGAPHGNVGDSWCAMGRIAWFDALSRKRYGDVDGFYDHILNPLQQLLISHTWMRERLHCDGTQELNRTEAYFEYPAVVSMLLREVKYGIDIGYRTVSISPFGISEYNYHVGSVHVDFSPSEVVLELPGDKSVSSYSLHGVAKSTEFTIVVSGDKCPNSGKNDESKSSDSDGNLTFLAPQGFGCVVTCKAG